MNSRRWLLWMAAVWVMSFARTAHAEDCPSLPSTSTSERRALAKKWFASAEAAERAENDVAAVHAYQCSMTLVPHPFTAYNLARVAEGVGDLQLALDAYRNYLTLKPDAEDAPAVSAHVQALESRVASLRRPPPASKATAPAEVPAPPLVPVAADGSLPSPAAPDNLRLRLRTTDWMVMGAAGASVLAGGVLNLVARAKMSRCRSLADAGQLVEARSSCVSARPFAYTSYALMGAAVAAAVVDLTTVFIWKRQEQLSVIPTLGGLKLALRGRF